VGVGCIAHLVKGEILKFTQMYYNWTFRLAEAMEKNGCS